MTPEAAELARALVAAPWWAERAGMRMVGLDGTAVRICDEHDADAPTWAEADDVPDLDDPATVGVLLAMLLLLGRAWVDSANGSVTVEVWPVGVDPEIGATGPTLGVAVARALLAVREVAP